MSKMMEEICNNEYQEFLSKRNVNGIAVGNKVVNGKESNLPCLKIFVEKKEKLSMLDASDIIPKYYKGILTDIVEVGKIEAYAVNTAKVRPTLGGYSIGVANSGFVGTLGCLVSRGTGSKLETFILSNNHVMALSNTAPIGSAILQPGDGGINPTDVVAHLTEYKEIDFVGSNLLDCAIAKVDDIALVSSVIVDIGELTGIASAVVGKFVQKSGRTTGYTTGKILGVNASVNVNFGNNVATFTNQIITTDMSDPGDSGSVIVDDKKRIVGLLFAGSDKITIMNDIRQVLKYFRARLVRGVNLNG